MWACVTADPTVVATHADYHIYACRQYLSSGQLRRLYALQLFLNDLPRAGLTCIHLYVHQ